MCKRFMGIVLKTGLRLWGEKGSSLRGINIEKEQDHFLFVPMHHALLLPISCLAYIKLYP